MIYPDALSKLDKISTIIPQTQACVILNPETNVNFTENTLNEQLRTHVKSLSVNYLKDENDYMIMCSKIKKIVNLFDEIEHLKINVLNAPEALVNNVLINFHDIITKSIEIKINTIAPSHSMIVARNSELQVCFVNPLTNDSERKYFKASKVTFNADPQYLDIQEFERWTPISKFSKLKIEMIQENKSRIYDPKPTNYTATADLSYLLIRKSDVSETSISVLDKLDGLRQYDNSLITIDLQDCTEDTKLNGYFDEHIPFGLRGRNVKYSKYKNILEEIMKFNLRYIDIDINKRETEKEVAIVQKIHTLIQGNNSLERVDITIHEQTSIISILDSCESKPNIDSIVITCTQDLSKSVRSHVKEYKKLNIFKSVKIYIILPEIKEENKKCIIF
mmetsp:Transcript_4198/g.3520  ORF Transcript_4198/g.3520 Transcript_4198/m.3520 type:complete len:391 (+) Transcript_4198:549-1721(+)